MGTAPKEVPWTKRRRRYSRDELLTSLTQSLEGYGPDRYSIEPAERMRFAVQVGRSMEPIRTLVLSIPGRLTPERRRLLDHGWQRASSGSTPYFRRAVPDAGAASAAIIEAYSTVYGAVGDERGWNIVAPALRPRVAWPEPWTGEEQPIGPNRAGDSSTPRTTGGEAAATRRVPVRAVFGVLNGLFCAWAALQSFGHAGWTISMALVVAVLGGCVVLASAVAISRLPDAAVRRGAYLWGDSLVTRAWINFAFGALPAIVWAMLLIHQLAAGPR